MKILPAGGKDNARKDEGLIEKNHYNPPKLPSIKVKVKSPYVPLGPKENLKITDDQWGEPEKARKKLEKILSQTMGMASLTAWAHLIGTHIFLRSTSKK